MSVDVGSIVEPVVDSISSLVELTGDGGIVNEQQIAQLKGCAEVVVVACSQLVQIAYVVADAFNEQLFKDELLTATKAMEDQLNLVQEKTDAFCADGNSTAARNEFLSAAAGLGTVIQNLIAAADPCSADKVLRACEDAAKAAGSLLQASNSGSEEQIVVWAKKHSDATVHVVRMANTLAASATDPQKQLQFVNVGTAAQTSGRNVIVAAQALMGDKSDTNTAQLNNQYGIYGQVIHDLLVLADALPVKKLTLEEEVARAAEALEGSMRDLIIASRGKDEGELINAAKNTANLMVQLIQATKEVASNCDNARQKKRLKKAIRKVRDNCSSMVDSANKTFKDPNEDTKGKLVADITSVKQGVDSIKDAVVNPDGFDVAELETTELAFAQVDEEIKSAMAALLKTASSEQGTSEQLSETARGLAQRSLMVKSMLKKLADECEDPQRRQQLLDAAAEIARLTKDTIQAAFNLDNNKSDSQALNAAMEAMKSLQSKLDEASSLAKAENQLKESGDSSSSAGASSGASTVSIDGQSWDIVSYECDADDDELIQAACDAANNAGSLVELAAATLEGLEEGELREQILNGIPVLLEKSRELVEASRYLSLHPNDEEAMVRYQTAQAEFTVAVSNMAEAMRRANASQVEQEIAVAGSSVLELTNKVRAAAKEGGEALVDAAKEVLAESIGMLKSSEKTIELTDDEQQKEQIRNAQNDLQDAVKTMVACTTKVAPNPENEEEQAKLAQALDNVDDCVAKLTKACAIESSDQEIMEAVGSMSSSSSGGNSWEGFGDGLAQLYRERGASTAGQGTTEMDVFMECGSTMKSITNFLNDLPNMSAKDTVAGARTIAAQAQTVAKMIKEVAAKTSDTQLKKQLEDAGRFLRDGAVQIKILATVKSASGDDDGAISASVKSMMETIKEANEIVRRATLRRRITSAVTQVLTIKRAVNAFKRKIKKKREAEAAKNAGK
eukprot:TRINITY_DN6560_c1_g1_i1.p1 TRINITY_DN6560_c1_g1~~TRINITY_DN6560_c1_g1_i1.p1  ORF type:complete len:1000 (-),score=411.03 TRINITY_DN6560_c1_g1_i1:67-2952(-)